MGKTNTNTDEFDFRINLYDRDFEDISENLLDVHGWSIFDTREDADEVEWSGKYVGVNIQASTKNRTFAVTITRDQLIKMLASTVDRIESFHA